MKVEIVFEKELSRIKNFEIRYFVTQVFEQLCPEYFWFIPASTREHHSPIARVRGGLVHHTKLAVRFADSFMEMWPSAADTAYDEVIAAVLMHDMLKRGEVEDDLVTFGSHRAANVCHGLYCALKIEELWWEEYRGMMPEYRARRMIEAVRRHMGKWTHDVDTLNPLETEEMRLVVQTTHLADYAASRSLHKWFGERYGDDTMGYLR